MTGPWVALPVPSDPSDFGAMWTGFCPTASVLAGTDWAAPTATQARYLDMYIKQGPGIPVYGINGLSFIALNRVAKPLTFQPLLGCSPAVGAPDADGVRRARGDRELRAARPRALRARGDAAGGGVLAMTLAFAPWIIFAVVVNSPSTWEWGALGALVAALYAAVPKSRGTRVKLTDAATVAFFGALCVVGLFVSADDLEWLEKYAQVISSFALAALMLGSLAFVPFTEQYAREQVPREYWGTREFKRTNRLLSSVWGVTLLLAGVSALIAAGEHGTTYDVFNWIVPIVLIVGAIKFTAFYTGEEQRDDR